MQTENIYFARVMKLEDSKSNGMGQGSNCALKYLGIKE